MTANRFWPVTLREPAVSRPGDPASAGGNRRSPVVLRPLHKRDADAWLSLRSLNQAWLAEWEATTPSPSVPPGKPARGTSFSNYVQAMTKAAKAGQSLPFAITVDGRLVGQVTVSSIARGSLWSGSIGYWVGREWAGQGIIPTAVALAADHCFTALGLHRLEINVRPENAKSLRVVEKLGFRDEGVRERYLHINGQWCDHRTFALTREEYPESGLLARVRAARSKAAETRIPVTRTSDTRTAETRAAAPA